MEFDTITTAVVFVILVALATGVNLAMPMSTETVLMMVAPGLLIYGLLALLVGVKHGQYRATASQ